MMMLMVATMMMVFNSVQPVFAAGTPSVDLRKQLYELNALLAVQKLQVKMYSQDGSWSYSSTANFTDGVASLNMDIAPGPGLYRGYAYWNDGNGFPLFYSYDWKVSQFQPGMNMKDFPVTLYQSRYIRLKIDGPASTDGVWVNGNQAQFSAGYWIVCINQPWLVDELNITWNGHGGWNVSVDPSFPFGNVLILPAGSMDPSQNSVSHMSAMSYPGDNSWAYDTVTFDGWAYDPVQDNYSIKLDTALPNGTSVVVFFSYWDSSLGEVEYYSYSTHVDEQSILAPLGQNRWFDKNSCNIRVVYTDSTGKVRQTWVPASTSVAVGGGG